MLREEVRKNWESLKSRLKNWKEVVKVSLEVEKILPSFPLDYDDCKSKLEYWTILSNSHEMEATTQKVWAVDLQEEDETLFTLQILYSSILSMFKNLTGFWYKDSKRCYHDWISFYLPRPNWETSPIITCGICKMKMFVIEEVD